MTPLLTIAPGVTAAVVTVSDPDAPASLFTLTVEPSALELDMPHAPTLTLTINPEGGTVHAAQWAWPATADLPAVTEPTDLTDVPLPRLQDIARWAWHAVHALRLDPTEWHSGTASLEPSARPDGARYRVHMYRWGDPAADHTYEAADCDSFTAAFARAAVEWEDRGGKYGAVVWRQPKGEGGGWMKRHTGTWQVLATVGMKDVPKEAP